MAHRICCYTLFDVTFTGVLNRNRPSTSHDNNWVYKRNTQCNYDTILQVISLRSQPEIIKNSSRELLTDAILLNFGTVYQGKLLEQYYWKFEFEVQHSNVFNNGKTELGSLYNDCVDVPMIVFDHQTKYLMNFLDITDKYKNIHFEVL